MTNEKLLKLAKHHADKALGYLKQAKGHLDEKPAYPKPIDTGWRRAHRDDPS